MSACLKVSSAITLLLLSAFALASPQQVSIKSTWTPPASRNAKTPFAPKPLGGDNIFKGEAEIWLADAVEKVEGGIFTPIDDKVVVDYVSQVGNHLVSYSVAPQKQCKLSLLGFARFDELEADRAAFYNTYKAGYNPYALATVLKRMARQEKEDMGKDQYRQYQFLVLLFGNHPPTAQRSMALSWESNFVKMPAKDSRYHSGTFDAMKLTR